MDENNILNKNKSNYLLTNHTLRNSKFKIGIDPVNELCYKSLFLFKSIN